MPSNSVVRINMQGFNRLKQYVGKMDDVVLKATDKALANLGAEGRKALGKYEEEKFHYGEKQLKWNYKRQTYTSKVHTYMNEKHGWYMASDGRRMIGFKFENASYKRRANAKNELTARLNAVSTGYVYSLIGNLYYKPVHYTKTSPWFMRYGSGFGKANRWGRGFTRKQRVTMNASRLNSALEPARRRTDEDIEKILAMEGLK